MAIEDGGPAFPRPSVYSDEETAATGTCEPGESGMSVRTYIAIEAMKPHLEAKLKSGDDWTFEDVAADSCKMADALMKALEAQP
jgi:hypothetical protein